MEMNLVNNLVQAIQNTQAVDQHNVIAEKDIKSILYLGIKGQLFIPVDDKHTVDTYA
jgi:hypothetical protein